MDLGSLSQLIGSFTLDDNSLALIAPVGGHGGRLNPQQLGADQQLRTKKLKIDRVARSPHAARRTVASAVVAACCPLT